MPGKNSNKPGTMVEVLTTFSNLIPNLSFDSDLISA